MWLKMDLHYHFLQHMFHLCSYFNKMLTGGLQVRCTPSHLPPILPAIQKHSQCCIAEVMAWGAADSQQDKKRWFKSNTLKETSHNGVGSSLMPRTHQLVGFGKDLDHEKRHHSWQSRHEGQVGPLVIALWEKPGQPYIQGDFLQRAAITRHQEDTLGEGKKRVWPSVTVTLRNEGRTWEDGSHQPPLQGGLSEGLMLPPAQLQAHQAQRQ